jgi:rubrerythrin
MSKMKEYLLDQYERKGKRMSKGWHTAKCGHIIERKGSPCPGCDYENYINYWAKEARV